MKTNCHAGVPILPFTHRDEASGVGVEFYFPANFTMKTAATPKQPGFLIFFLLQCCLENGYDVRNKYQTSKV
jgi:hypothetical protein